MAEEGRVEEATVAAREVEELEAEATEEGA